MEEPNKEVTCSKCGYVWTPRLAHPLRCPSCLTKKWDKNSGKGTPEAESSVSIGSCKWCSKPLHMLKWFNNHIPVCDNIGCRMYHTPTQQSTTNLVLPELDSSDRMLKLWRSLKT